MRSVMIAAAFALAACGGGQEAASNEGAAAWNSEPPNARNLQPAFEGQTRAPALRSDFALNVETFADDLEEPWGIEALPDGRFIVTEKPGRLRLVGADGALSAPIAGVPAVDDDDQGGLLDIALSPTFARDRTLYFSFSEPRSGNRNGTSVARAQLSADETRLENLQVIFRQEPSWASEAHYGSRIVFAPDGRLWITLGDRQQMEPRHLAQDVSTLIGKVVRINPDGSIPEDNPFAGQAGARPEIWSIGHRNVQGADIHPDTGALWTVEHGPRGGDEVNRPEAGRNYGWPTIIYGLEYSGAPVGEGISQQEGLEQPVYYWDPVIAPGGMRFYRGVLFPGWRGDMLVASLRGALVRLKIEGERVVGEERLLTDQGRIRDVAEAADGALYIITDDGFDRILRVTPAP